MSNFWRGRVTFVTGATGLMGSWLVKHLVTEGASVICLVHGANSDSMFWKEGLDEQVRIVQGDITDSALIERILHVCRVDTVFHLAAQTIVGVANRNPVGAFEANIRGTWTLLEACRLNPTVRQIVVASSDKAYGTHEVLPYTEDLPLQGRQPYEVSKTCTDLIAQSYAHSFGLPVCITRCGNLYGGGDPNSSRLIPGTISSVLQGKSPIIRSDGQFTRDYFYVEDAVGAYSLLAESLATDRSLIGEAFNFSSDQPATALEVVETVIQVMRSPVRPTILNEVSNEIRDQRLDSSKARRMLGWDSRFSLASGLGETVDWYRAFSGSDRELQVA